MNRYSISIGDHITWGSRSLAMRVDAVHDWGVTGTFFAYCDERSGKYTGDGQDGVDWDELDENFAYCDEGGRVIHVTAAAIASFESPRLPPPSRDALGTEDETLEACRKWMDGVHGQLKTVLAISRSKRGRDARLIRDAAHNMDTILRHVLDVVPEKPTSNPKVRASVPDDPELT